MHPFAPRPVRRTTPIGIAVVLALSLGLAARAAALPTASFSTAALSVDEAAGSVTVTILIDGPGNHGGVIVGTMDGDAAAGTDYTPVSTYVSWPGEDTSPKDVVIPLVVDGDPETPEDFVVQFTGADGVLLGNPSSVTVTITEGGPAAYFVLDDAIPSSPTGQFFVPVDGNGDLAVPLRLAQFPGSPVTVDYLVGTDPTVHSVLFDGVQEQLVTIPGEDPPGGSLLAVRHVRVVAARESRRLHPASEFFAGTAGFTDADECVFCGLQIMLNLFGFEPCDQSCAIDYGADCYELGRGTRGAAPLDVLRRYRDEVLATTSGGQYWINRYRDLSGEVARAVLRKPGLIYDVWRARGPWFDGIAALLAGDGDSFVITPQMESDLTDIVAQVRAQCDPVVDALIGTEVTNLGLDSMAGKTMTEMQQDVETAGGLTAVAPMSWGRVKAAFRE